MVKKLPALQETQVRSLGQEDPLEKGMATHSSILAWRIPWIEEPGQLQSMGLQKAGKKTKEEELLNSFYEASGTFIPKPNKDNTKIKKEIIGPYD